MATHVKDLNTQVELAELLVAHAESNFVLGKARSWKLTNYLRVCVGGRNQIGRSLDTVCSSALAQ